MSLKTDDSDHDCIAWAHEAALPAVAGVKCVQTSTPRYARRPGDPDTATRSTLETLFIALFQARQL